MQPAARFKLFAVICLLLRLQQLVLCVSTTEYNAIDYSIISLLSAENVVDETPVHVTQYTIANPPPLLHGDRSPLEKKDIPSSKNVIVQYTISNQPAILHTNNRSPAENNVAMQYTIANPQPSQHIEEETTSSSSQSTRKLLQSAASSSACVECFPGSYADGTTNGDSCLPCPKDTFATMFGSVSCTPCPNGTFTEGTGSYYEAQCMPTSPPESTLPTTTTTTSAAPTPATTTTTTAKKGWDMLKNPFTKTEKNSF